ncbi:MAG TPA: hypothetical protein PKA84_01365 [Rubrivivax sp.]|nr:hypothetical protein [Rubrivivax sp.]HMR68858.1 hypothetical protein [Rubrivivax sp.]
MNARAAYTVTGPARGQDARCVWLIAKLSAPLPGMHMVEIEGEAFTYAAAQRRADELNAAARAAPADRSTATPQGPHP